MKFILLRTDPSNFGIAHRYIGDLHRPNNALVIAGRDFSAVHHTDGYGFRNSWPWPETAEVITLGDSLTFGYGVEDAQSWPAILGRAFSQLRIINLGLIGAGPQQYLRVYETFGVKLRPKLVLVGAFIRNDFWDAEMFDGWLKSGAGGNYMIWRDYGRPPSVSLSLRQPIRNLARSLFWRGELLARKTYIGNLLLYSQGRLNMWAPSGIKVFQAQHGTRLELQPGDLYSKTKLARPGTPVFELVVGALQSIHSLAKQNAATALVVLLPSKEEVYLPLLDQPPPDPGVSLRKALEEQGIPYLDLMDKFRRDAANGEVLFFEADGHPNARGYALIADLVIAHLKQHAQDYGL